MPKYDRKIIFGFSDPHGGFKYGLFNPETIVKDERGNKICLDVPSDVKDTSSFIWDTFEWGFKETSLLAGKDEIIAFCLGDVTHGNKYISEQVSTKIAQQLDIAFYNFLPVISQKNVKMIRIAGGTPVHVFGEATAEEVVCNRLAEKFPKKDFKVVLHGLCNIHGLGIDYAHKGPPPGRRNWLQGNEATLYLKSAMMSELDAGNDPPKLYLRGHYHTYTKAWARVVRNRFEHESWLIIFPGLSSLGDFGTDATRSTPTVSVGTIAFEIINGELYKVHPFLQTLDVRSIEDYD